MSGGMRRRTLSAIIEATGNEALRKRQLKKPEVEAKVRKRAKRTRFAEIAKVAAVKPSTKKQIEDKAAKLSKARKQGESAPRKRKAATRSWAPDYLKRTRRLKRPTGATR